MLHLGRSSFKSETRTASVEVKVFTVPFCEVKSVYITVGTIPTELNVDLFN